MKKISVRALFIGTLMCLVINVVMSYGVLVMGTFNWTGDFISGGAILLLFLLIVLYNTPLAMIRRQWALSSQELVLIYTMMIVGTAIPTVGLTAQLIPFLAEVFYYASPENAWSELIHPHLKSWLVPQDDLAVFYFFEGLPDGQSIPWNVWYVPLAAWGSFVIALYLMMISMVALMHKQWSQHERLIYPLVQLPIDMVRDDEESGINPFLKNWVMWLGFLIPMVLLGVNALSRYSPGLHGVGLSTTVQIFPEVRHLLFSVWFIVIGLTYFLSLEVSFSLWFFYLFYYLENVLFSRVGFSIPELRLMHTEGSIATAQQAMGAMIAFVIVAVWTARGHLKTAFVNAFSPSRQNSHEGFLSHRTAVCMLLGATAYTILFLNQAGLPLFVATFLMAISFVVFFGLTKIVAEGGMGYGRAQMTPTAFTIMTFGNSPIGNQGLTVLGLCNGWAGDIKICLMAAVANGAKLADLAGLRGVTLFWAMMLAIVVSLISSAWTVITIAYEYGGINLHYWFYHIMGDWTFRNIATAISSPIDSWNFFGPRGVFTTAGAAIMFALTYIRHRFLWWPLHPIGFPVGGTYMMYFAWSSMFIAWIIKLIILRYGGSKLYRKLRPLFLGMVLGQVTSHGLWMMVDYFTGMTGDVSRW